MVMNQDVILKYPKLDNEIIKVTNFLVIKEAEMKCGDITVLVGEQATGKSLLAKLRYFFWEYQEDLMNFDSFIFDGIKKFKDIDVYKKHKVEIFCDLFPNIANMQGGFSIDFECGDIAISVKKNSKIKINHSNGLDAFIELAQGVLDNIGNVLDKELASNNKPEISAYGLVERRYFLLIDRVALPSVPSVLYVPASRLFFATIQGNIFRFTASEEYTFDQLLKQFAGFWEGHRKHFSDEFEKPKRNKTWFKDARKILAGRYFYKDGVDYIENDWGGTVELKHASSGQQEVLPLLAAINYFPSEYQVNQLLIIEEPEAHIYPTSQRDLIKMIAEVARNKDCKVMITTHSPYIPACVNNEIHPAQSKDKNLTASAYHLSDRTANYMYYEKQHVIDVDKLDEVSDTIAEDYYKLTKKQNAIKNSKDKKGE